MKIVPVTIKQARDFISKHHRHNKPPVGWKFGVGLLDDTGRAIGVATAGRCVSRVLDTATTLEINRTCTLGDRNANSMLYGAIRRAAIALGYTRIYTYTQAAESGASLRAAGFRVDAQLSGRSNWRASSAGARGTRDASEPQFVDRVRWVWP